MKENSTRFCFIAGLIGCLILSAGCSTMPADKPEKKATASDSSLLSVSDMQSDFSALWSAIKEVHPGYGIYVSADSLSKKYDEVMASLATPMSEDDYIVRMYPFLCALGCGHTQIKHAENYHPAQKENNFPLPFNVLVRGERAWVTKSGTEKLSTGDEIISVNDVPVSAIIQNGSSLYCGDGFVKSFKELFLSEYDGFADACIKYYHWNAPYHVSIRTISGELQNITINNFDTAHIPAVQTIDKYALWTKAEGTETLGLYFHKNANTALLKVPQLVYSDTTAYGKCFSEISNKGVHNLILDMRHNGGGDLRITIRLMSYLMNADFKIIRDLYSRLPDPSINKFSVLFDSSLTENFRASCKPGKKVDTHYHMDVRPEFGEVYGPVHPAATNRFNGKLIVLIDGATFSSASLFVSALKAQRSNIVFVGRETAGTEEGCNGFSMQLLTLPATQARVQFPWLRVVSMAKASVHGRGLMPDYPVEYTPEDIVKGRDPDLEKAMNLVR
ncbi:hypothetical protein HHL16_04440 [Pseudoflavitalea sp. G-6-1-2]|uniref:S41 family peptidase n=1 Tax=Pseudoflavitalea sp. G-6-1-2 TaxID=2728841 RepID=UPI00146E619E|nr:S41 family peptidase [Pseudoflavitalea sp. G-6-1-2]NML20108.1 hypothetical protein [Pseudoflavitalea sp. G-6-1-2]